MVHPSALSGKTTHSLEDIGNAIRDLIFREYNKDARPGKVSYREPGMPPLRQKYLGQPAVIPSPLPAVAVEFSSVVYSDAPQDAGSDNEAEVKIFLYGTEMTRAAQQDEAIRMAECVRHIIIDNPTMPTAAGTEQVYQLGYREMRIEFDRLLQNFQGEFRGVEVAVLTAIAVFAETGF